MKLKLIPDFKGYTKFRYLTVSDFKNIMERNLFRREIMVLNRVDFLCTVLSIDSKQCLLFVYANSISYFMKF